MEVIRFVVGLCWDYFWLRYKSIDFFFFFFVYQGKMFEVELG